MPKTSVVDFDTAKKGSSAAHPGGFHSSFSGRRQGCDVAKQSDVCDNAKEGCPVFLGAAKQLHRSFEDPPPKSEGSDEERMTVFRRVRDELRQYLGEFAQQSASIALK